MPQQSVIICGNKVTEGIIKIMNKIKFGWVPDLPDHRDVSIESSISLDSVAGVSNSVALPKSADIRGGFSPIENQGSIGSCTAQAGVALVEYMERKFGGQHIEASRLFLYKNTRKLAGFQGDTGAYLRDTIKALRLFGVSQEQYWPYDVTKFDEEPDAFNYALANNYKSLKYFRVDMPNYTPDRILKDIKSSIAKGIPLMFGSVVYNGIMRAKEDIPYPAGNERPIGGHAMVICGYDDSRVGVNASIPGAFLIRNSWGTNWGMQGYAWFPYEYLYSGLMMDIWGITKQDWIDTSVFN